MSFPIHEQLPNAEYPYMGDSICIKQTGSHEHEAFVSKYNGGDDSWFSLSDSFAPDGVWKRSGWEVAVIRNKEDTDRRGFYVNAKYHTVYITVKTLKEIEVVSVKRPE